MRKIPAFLLLVFLMSACSSDDSPSIRLAGNYLGILNCSQPTAIKEIFDDIKVTSVGYDSILIELKPGYGVISGTINETDEVTILPYRQEFDDGSLVDIISGKGEFYLHTITGTTIQAKTIDTTLDHKDVKRACQLLLNEDI